jgi:drug/metabolite transporter (DMT)-like permease
VFSFWRLWFGSVFVGTLALVGRGRARRRGDPWILSPTGIRWTLIAGVAFAIHQVLFMASLRATSVVDVTLMNTLSPVIVAVLAVSLFGERPGLAFRLWSVLAISGAGLVALAGSTGPQGNPVGMALGAGNVVFYSLFFVWSKRARDHIDTLPFVAGMTAVAAVVVSLFVLATGAPIGAATSKDLLLCLAVAVGPGLIGHFSVSWAVKWVPANIPPIIMLSIPLFSGVLAWLVLGQGATWLKLAGGLVTLGGVAGAIRSQSGRSTAAEALPLASET